MLEDRSDGLIVVWMNVAQQHDGELNAWYEGEHVAEIAGLPGVHAVRRYLDSAHRLRYMAMFECADDSVEGGTAFTRMIDNATPWTRRIRTLFGEQRLRGNYRKLHGEGGSTAGAALLVVHSHAEPRLMANAKANVVGCTRYRAYAQSLSESSGTEPSSFRPPHRFLEVYEFSTLSLAASAHSQLKSQLGVDISVRQAIGTPISVPIDVVGRRCEVEEAQGVASAMAAGFQRPRNADVIPAVRFCMRERDAS